MCCRCLSVGVVKPARVVDHLIPARVCDDFFDRENLFPVCVQCHSDITKIYDDRNLHEIFTTDYASVKYGNKEFRRASNGYPADSELDKIILSVERVGRGVSIPAIFE